MTAFRHISRLLTQTLYANRTSNVGLRPPDAVAVSGLWRQESDGAYSRARGVSPDIPGPDARLVSDRLQPPGMARRQFSLLANNVGLGPCDRQQPYRPASRLLHLEWRCDDPPDRSCVRQPTACHFSRRHSGSLSPE